MKTKAIYENIEIHTVPLEDISISDIEIIIEFDDINKKRIKLIFKPYQAFKVTTIDCISVRDYDTNISYMNGRYHRHIIEILDSPWISELKKCPLGSNHSFMGKAHHYFLLLGDNGIEIITYDNFKIENIN